MPDPGAESSGTAAEPVAPPLSGRRDRILGGELDGCAKSARRDGAFDNHHTEPTRPSESAEMTRFLRTLRKCIKPVAGEEW